MHTESGIYTFSQSSHQVFSQCQSNFQPVKFSRRFQIFSIDAILIFISLFTSSRYLVDFFSSIYLFIYLYINPGTDSSHYRGEEERGHFAKAR
jgi:hypothetical protein